MTLRLRLVTRAHRGGRTGYPRGWRAQPNRTNVPLIRRMAKRAQLPRLVFFEIDYRSIQIVM
jgi:hypothetical protein